MLLIHTGVEHQDDIRNVMADADKLLENEVNSELEVVIIRNETEDNNCSEFVEDSNQDDEVNTEEESQIMRYHPTE